MATNSLRFWRKQRGISQKNLAEKIGSSQPMVCYFETGEREPTMETWKQIEAVLNIPLETLFAEPPFSFGSNEDSLIERVTTAPVVGDESVKSKRVNQPNGFRRVTFLSESNAKVGLQLQKTIKLTDEEWDGVRVWVELPCGDDPLEIQEAKTEAVGYCQRFLNEEIKRIQQEYIDQFNHAMVETVDGEVPSVSQDN